VNRNLGKAPQSSKTPVDVALNSIELIDKQKKLLEKGENKLLAMKADFGHIMKIDTNALGAAARQLDAAKVKFTSIPGTIAAFQKKKSETIEAMRKKFKEGLANYDVGKLKDIQPDMDIDALLDLHIGKPGSLWHSSGMRFVERCRDMLPEDPETFGILRGLGFRTYTIERSWLGINRESIRFEREDWGLKPSDDGDDPRALFISAGIVIPCFDGPDLQRITVRPVFDQSKTLSINQISMKCMDSRNDTRVDGSRDPAMVLGFEEGKPLVCVADELEALLLHQELGKFYAITAMNGPSIPLDKETASAIQKSPQFLVVSYPDILDHAPDSLESWKNICPHAQMIALPEGKNIFEAKKPARTCGSGSWMH
jgi:hypothetical protein